MPPVGFNSSISTATTPDTASPTTVTVRMGQTLQQVADENHVDLKDLMAENHITNPYSILPGQQIQIPKQSYAPSSTTSTPIRDDPSARQTYSSPRAGSVESKGMVEMKLRESTINQLSHKGIDAGMQAWEAGHLVKTLSELPSGDFDRVASQVRKALDAGDKNGALRALGLADAGMNAVKQQGGGRAIQADSQWKADGLHFDFDRPVSQQQAADLIFQGGKVPDGTKLVPGQGNAWVVQVPNDPERANEWQQNVASHLNSHMETVDNLHPHQSTFTWVVGGAHKPAPVSQRKDIDNDFGFKITKHYKIDEGQAPTTQLRNIMGKGYGYEMTFDKPMTKDEVMAKLFREGAKFGKNDVQLQAVPQEPSNTYQVSIIGVDAIGAIKHEYGVAFADSVTKTPESLNPNLPENLRRQFDNHSIPPDAKKFPPDAYVWEQDGYIARVESDGKGYYKAEATKMPDEPGLKKTIQYFMEEKGLPSREAWKAFDKHWEELDRQMIMALMSFYGAAGGSLGGAPDAEVSATMRPRLGRVGEGLEGDVGAEARGAKSEIGLANTERQDVGLANTEKPNIGLAKTEKQDIAHANTERPDIGHAPTGKQQGNVGAGDRTPVSEGDARRIESSKQVDKEYENLGELKPMGRPDPKAGEPASVDKVLDDMEHGTPVGESTSSKFHKQAYRDATGKTGDVEPPVAYKVGKGYRIDYTRLTDAQKARLKTIQAKLSNVR